MKLEDLLKLEIPEDTAKKLLVLHGKDIEAHKAKIKNYEEVEIPGLKEQVTQANDQIKSFKEMDIEGIKAAAAKWETTAKQLETDNTTALATLKYDHALEGALKEAKVKNVKSVQALLDKEALKYNEKDGTIVGLAEQLEAVKKENDYLFEDTEALPKITVRGNSQSVVGDPTVDAAREAAGLPVTAPAQK